MTNMLLTAAGLFALSVFLRWITRPDPSIVKQTKERREMRLRDDAANRWEP